ncbi:MAG: hypothetical protein V1837_05360 [Candidatus Woesearchaeota archaeon]
MPKNHKVRFSVSLEEKQKIIQNSEACGYSKTATYCRDMILKKPQIYEERIALLEIYIKKIMDKLGVEHNGK